MTGDNQVIQVNGPSALKVQVPCYSITNVKFNYYLIKY